MKSCIYVLLDFRDQTQFKYSRIYPVLRKLVYIFRRKKSVSLLVAEDIALAMPNHTMSRSRSFARC